MLLTITTTHQPARDLGYLVAKHPDRIQNFSLSQGKATVFWPEASAERATVCLMVEVRRKGGGPAVFLAADASVLEEAEGLL